MIATCKEHGAQVILFTCPFSPFPHEHMIGFGEPIKQYAQSRGVPYFDLFEYTEEMGFDWDTDLRDRGHLNDSGAGKVADFLGKYITENYDI